MKIKLSEQVAGFVRSLAPEPRREIRLALKSLAKRQGDVKALEGPLARYWRLRVLSYRVILFYRSPNEVECVFAEHRSIIYEVFAEELRKKLAAASKKTSRCTGPEQRQSRGHGEKIGRKKGTHT